MKTWNVKVCNCWKGNGRAEDKFNWPSWTDWQIGALNVASWSIVLWCYNRWARNNRFSRYHKVVSRTKLKKCYVPQLRLTNNNILVFINQYKVAFGVNENMKCECLQSLKGKRWSWRLVWSTIMGWLANWCFESQEGHFVKLYQRYFCKKHWEPQCKY